MNEKRQRSMGVGLALGVAVGVAFGAAWDNMGLGIAFGLAIGIVFGSTGAFGGRRKREEDPHSDGEDGPAGS